MTRDDIMKAEVHRAVRDYLDQLIHERSGKGKGMALTNNDLFVAAKKAGQKTAQVQTDNATKGLARSGMDVLKPQQAPGLEANGVSVQGKNTRGNKNRDYHWMVWKTPPTPAPKGQTIQPAAIPEPTRTHKPEAPRPVIVPTPQPTADPVPVPVPPSEPKPDSPVQLRPLTSASSICDIPIAPTPIHVDTPSFHPVALQSPTPEPFREPTSVLRTVGPPVQFANTTQPVDVISLSHPKHTHSAGVPRGVMPAFKPALRAWAARADPHDKDVVYDMFKSLNGGRSTVMSRASTRASTRPDTALSIRQVATPAPTAPSTKRLPTAGVRTCQPIYTNKYPELHDKYMQKLTRSISRSEERQTQPEASVPQCPPGCPCPQHQQQFRPRYQKQQKPRYPSRRWPTPIPYTCETSFFNNSQMPYRSNFDISPEWVSEVKTARKNAMWRVEDARVNAGRYNQSCQY